MSKANFSGWTLLGKGSFGAVYRCKRKTDGHEYAVKEVNIEQLSTRERQDAVNEIRILASLNHTNIVKYCEAFPEGDNLYIVMEFAEGGDLHKQIQNAKTAVRPIAEDCIWSYLIQVTRGLHELHRQSILHRDLKSKNIFITKGQHVRIGDLGCAKLMKANLTRTQVGTPYYMSPEIWAKQPYNDKSDMWALGCVMYELCALSPPFLAQDMPSLAHRVQTSRTPSIPRCYSADLSRIITMLLSKTPADRPTAAQLLDMASVKARMSTVPVAVPDRWSEHERESKIISTIKVPKRQSRRGLDIHLPSPAYPKRRLYTSPSKSDGRVAAAVVDSRAAVGDPAARRPATSGSNARDARPRTPPPAAVIANSRRRGTMTPPDKALLRLPKVPSMEGAPPSKPAIVTARDARDARDVRDAREARHREAPPAPREAREPSRDAREARPVVAGKENAYARPGRAIVKASQSRHAPPTSAAAPSARREPLAPSQAARLVTRPW